MTTPDLDMHFLCLGSGTSHGVPMIGCSCAVCRSHDPRNKRTRSSAMISIGDVSLLIDTSTDLRQQALKHGLTRVDAVLYTHAHADHLHGIDDLRSFTLLQRQAIPCFGDGVTLEQIRQRYPYLFRDPEFALRWSIPRVELRPIDGPFEAAGIPVTPVPIHHGNLKILGYRIGALAYITDCSAIPDPSMDLLRDLHTLVIDGLRPQLHSTHFNIAQALEAIAELNPHQAFLTHLTHDVDHPAIEADLPDDVYLAYDGLRITVPAHPS